METKLMQIRTHIDNNTLYFKIEQQDEKVREFLSGGHYFRCPDTDIIVYSNLRPEIRKRVGKIELLFVRGKEADDHRLVCLETFTDPHEEKRRLLTALKNMCDAIRSSEYDWEVAPNTLIDI